MEISYRVVVFFFLAPLLGVIARTSHHESFTTGGAGCDFRRTNGRSAPGLAKNYIEDLSTPLDKMILATTQVPPAAAAR